MKTININGINFTLTTETAAKAEAMLEAERHLRAVRWLEEYENERDAMEEFGEACAAYEEALAALMA